MSKKKYGFLERLFVSSQSNDAKQTHLSRIVFSHVSYVERFRRYIVYIKSKRGQEWNEDAIKANKKIISYIIRYLALFDATPFLATDRLSILLENEFLPHDYLTTMEKQRACKSIGKIIFGDDDSQNKQFSKIRKGFENQSLAQNELLNRILKICNSGYRSLYEIEIPGR